MNIYISTNPAQPANCFEERAKKQAVRNIVQRLETNVIYEIVQNVYLLMDSHNIAITLKEGEDSGLLFHENTQLIIQNQFVKKVKGHHLQGSEYLYAPVFAILLDDNISNNAKADKISEVLFGKKRLEKLFRHKTDFLYSIYKGNKPESIQIPEIVNQTAGIENFIQYFNDNPFNKDPKTEAEQIKSKEQIAKFNELRIVLGIK